MHDISTTDGHGAGATVALDTDSTLEMADTPPAPVTERLVGQGSLPSVEDDDRHSQRDTPRLPAPPPSARDVRATLTVLTGLRAGHLVTVDGAAVTIGRATDADLVVNEIGVSRHHARIARTPPPGGLYVEDLASTNGTFVGAERVGVALLRRGDILRLGPHLRISFAMVDPIEVTLHRRLYEASVLDPLTHVFNRRYLMDRLSAEVARARRAGGDVSVLMIDVDSLKTVNDSFGHLAGDRALCAIAARILRALRVEDVMGRYGGDEFIVLAGGTHRVEAEHLAERVRRAVEGLRMTARGRGVRITTSIGVASLGDLVEDDEPVSVLLAAADARMYGAKIAGKNRVCAVTPPESRA